MMKKSKCPAAFVLTLVLCLVPFFRLFPQQGNPAGQEPAAAPSAAGINAIYAAEEFRLGVQAYNRHAFNEAILSLERALSFRPGEPLILDWLGRVYYRSGLDDTALRQWRAAAGAYGWSTGNGVLLGSRIETISNRRNLLPVADDEVRYVEAGRYPGRNEETVLYRQPSSVLALEDGSAWIVAYGSNEIVRVDVNGIVKERRRGPLNGFDRPYDLVKGPGDRLYLSEYRGSRISVLNSGGEWLSYIGSRGRGNGFFVGPQNLAVDEEGYLYVVDYGNRRICKFDPDGNFILSVGPKIPGFPGFRSPTGIAVKDGRLYAADGAAKRIYIFDRNGHYEGVLAGEGLRGPESLRFLSDGRLLAADTNRLLLIDTESALIRELGILGSGKVRIIGADMDRNGNILAANFEAGEVSVLTRFDDLASGLFVQIERVQAESFPLVTVDIQVQDRLRRPITGLEGLNFVLSEQGQTVAEQNFLLPGYRIEEAGVSILLERSPRTQALGEELAAAVRDIGAALDGGAGQIVSVVSAGVQPQRESLEGSLDRVSRGTAASFNPRWRFDLGLRLAATDLIPVQKKRGVVFVCSGALGDLAFEQYGLSELAAYLSNNHIVFNAVVVGGGEAAEEIRYLCRETGGQVLPLYRPQGIQGAIKALASYPSGSYTLSYRSQLPTDFGRAYLPVEVEVYMMERSGRDGTGYFPPLE
jgi:DNA-binding beta-propeller fold protein YncE